MKTYYYRIALTIMLSGLLGCEERLEEEVFSELSPSTLFTSEQGLSSLLNAAYAYSHRAGDDEIGRAHV